MTKKRVQRKSKGELREEEYQDRQRFSRISEVIVKGQTMELLKQTENPSVEYELQIDNTLDDGRGTPYRATVRVEVQLAPVGDSWQIVARRTKRFTLEGADGPRASVPLKPMREDAEDPNEVATKSSAAQAGGSQMQQVIRFLKECFLFFQQFWVV